MCSCFIVGWLIRMKIGSILADVYHAASAKYFTCPYLN